MKSILLWILILGVVFNSAAQNAVDFTANDCSGNPHNLFTEIGEGKVIVICWVMPCGSCTGPALTSFNVVGSYQSTHPGRVFFYMVDDFANSTCSEISSWATSKGIAANNYSLRFVDASIKMLDYGTVGMPKTIVVGGGNSPKVFYNVDNTIDADWLVAGIDEALLPTSVTDPVNAISKIKIYPSPVSDKINVEMATAQSSTATLALMDITGKIIAEYPQPLLQGENQFTVDISTFNNGIYFLRINNQGEESIHKFVVQK